MEFTARKDWMARVGVSPKSPLEAKVRAFKGARLGPSTVGGGPAQYLKYLAGSFDLDPNHDMKLLGVGFGAARIAALRENQVDITVGDAPEADEVALEGFGELFLNCATEVPLFRQFPYTVLVVQPEFAARQPETTRRIAQTIGQANDLIHSNLGDVIDILKGEFPKIDPVAIERAMARDQDAFPRGARMSTQMWENGIKVAAAMKTVKTLLPLRRGRYGPTSFSDRITTRMTGRASHG